MASLDPSGGSVGGLLDRRMGSLEVLVDLVELGTGHERVGGGVDDAERHERGEHVAARSRTRSEPVTRGVLAEDVADEADGVEQRGAVLVELAAEVGDVGLQDVRVAVEVVLPDVIEDLRPSTAPDPG